MMPLYPPTSIFDVLLAYQRSLEAAESPQKAEALMAQLQTALLRYTLPGWGFPSPQGQRLKAVEVQAGLEYLQHIALEQLPDAPNVQERMFETLQVPGNSRRNYRLALNKLMDWCRQQSWYPRSNETPPRRTPRQHQPKGSVTQVRLTVRKRLGEYGLGAVESDVIPPALQQELDTFYAFLVTPAQQHDPKNAVGRPTANQYMHHLLLVLGWLYRVRQVPLADLRLTTVVEFVPLNSQPVELPVVAAAVERTMTLVQDYLAWLQSEPPDAPLSLSPQAGRGSQSPRTVSKVLLAVLAVAKFLYHQETQYPTVKRYHDIPVIERLREEQRKVIEKIKAHPLVSDQSKKQINRAEFLQLVEALRAECAPRFLQSTQSKHQGKTLGPQRSLAGIAQSYQRFLLAAFLAYLLPHRQQVYRQLQFFLDPLPEKGGSAFPEKNGAYLYRQGEKWWIKVFPDLYKQDRDKTKCWVGQVPNHQYGDGRCFYQYLEEWLLHYSYPKHGKTMQLKGLRSCFDPQHQFVFTTKGGEPYTHPAAFAALLRIPAYRLMKKALSLDAVRLMLSKEVRE